MSNEQDWNDWDKMKGKIKSSDIHLGLIITKPKWGNWKVVEVSDKDIRIQRLGKGTEMTIWHTEAYRYWTKAETATA